MLHTLYTRVPILNPCEDLDRWSKAMRWECYRSRIPRSGIVQYGLVPCINHESCIIVSAAASSRVLDDCTLYVSTAGLGILQVVSLYLFVTFRKHTWDYKLQRAIYICRWYHDYNWRWTEHGNGVPYHQWGFLIFVTVLRGNFSSHLILAPSIL